ncbi:MAG: prepilin-type N-terminal cleavage/methylation domain-containing protein [Ruminococcaceae bacterium]|nr:prepilin-type N-terminal cleavage/methylation domain-containing protein [Oscillospiraceae bacterium]
MKNIKKIQFNNLITKSSDELNALKKSRKSGFTLIELIVVVAVIALLVAFSTATFVSVTRRKATRVGKLIDSELTLLASNTYSREGQWRLVFEYDPKEKVYVMIQQFNIAEKPKDDVEDDDLTDGQDNKMNDEWNDQWNDFSRTPLSPSVELSFGDDDFDESDNKDTYYISLSREKGCYLSEGVFAEDSFEGEFNGNIYVRSANKVVTIHMSKESGGHRVVD